MFKKIVNLLIFASLGFFVGLSICSAQNETGLHMKKNDVISKGSNNSPVGELGVTTYRLEKIRLETPLDLKDGMPPIDYAFHLLIITDKELPVSGFSIWLNDTQLSASATDSKLVGAMLYRRALPDGATLGLSKYGEDEIVDRSILPEKLNVPSEYAISLEELEPAQVVIKLLRRSLRVPVMELRLDIPEMPCYIGGIGFLIEIDGRNFNSSCAGRSMFLSFSIEEFAKLRDGAEVAVKRGAGRESAGRRVVGRLNKSTIEYE
ncbi:MAG TPA: hypothetical protein PKD24_17275 [Pyrinomonadaceae bacterium]|nr:hypothetical protein [Pyrinomonadaceae bacterium]